MEKRIVTQDGVAVAVIESDVPIITDAGSALDLIASLWHGDGCTRVAVRRSAVTEDFFILRTGLAGDLLQKFVNYRVKLAVIGDFSGETSKPLQDFIRECNRGNEIFFVNNEQEAIAKLTAAR